MFWTMLIGQTAGNAGYELQGMSSNSQFMLEIECKTAPQSRGNRKREDWKTGVFMSPILINLHRTILMKELLPEV